MSRVEMNGTVPVMTTTKNAKATAELSQARAALARAERSGNTAAVAHLRGIVGNLALIARAAR